MERERERYRESFFGANSVQLENRVKKLSSHLPESNQNLTWCLVRPRRIVLSSVSVVHRTLHSPTVAVVADVVAVVDLNRQWQRQRQLQQSPHCQVASY